MDTQETLIGQGTNKAQLESLRNIKGQLSRQIAIARKTGQGTEDLISRLKQVSDAIKSLQKQIKKNLNQKAEEEEWQYRSVSLPGPLLNKTVSCSVVVKICCGALSNEVDDYLARHPGATIWHRPIVASFIQYTYGHNVRYLCAVTGDMEVVGVLPLVHLKSRLFGNFLVAMPYFNYGGVLANNLTIAKKLIEAGDSWRTELGAKHMELRHCQDITLGYPQRTDKVTFLLPLPKKACHLWNSFKPKLRAQIRRGEREMSSFTIGGAELLDDFYKVFSVNMRDLGTPVYGREFFLNLLNSLPGQCWIVVVRIKGVPVGCAFLTLFKEKVEIPWASTLRKYSHTSINMIMYWKILEFSIAQGATAFDFGRCSEDSGTYQFKQQWGGTPLRLHWDYLQPEGQGLPTLNPSNPKLRLLVAAWKRLPVPLANFLGPRIVKVLP